MEVSHSILVAMMFVMILSIGIGNILMALPPLVDRPEGFEVSRLQISWIVLLLLMHLNLFWQVLLLLERDDWSFIGFVYTVTGPILLLLATSVLLPDTTKNTGDSFSGFHKVARPAFRLLALTMFWLPGMDVLFGAGIQPMSFVNCAAGGLFVVLAQSRSPKVHLAGAVAGWGVLLAAIAGRAVGVLT